MSQIAKVEIRAVGPDVERFTWAGLPPQYLTWALAKVVDDEGVEGVGLTLAYSNDGFDHSIFEALRPRVSQLIGRDSAAPEAAWQALRDLNIPIAPGVQAVLDIAMWDLHARRANLPLYRLLGGTHERLLAYASTPQLSSIEAYCELVAELAATGLQAVKFHAWNEPDRDIAMLRKVYELHGDRKLLLMHDAEMRYDRLAALRIGRELAEMGFRWFEAPLSDFDVIGYRELRRRLAVPIIPAGHWITQPQELARALAYEPWDAIRFDVTVAGGITPCRRLVNIAASVGLGAEVQSWGPSLLQAANMHVALAAEYPSYFELPVPTEAYEYGVRNPIRHGADGFVSPPEGPGLGIDIDWERIEHATLSAFTCSDPPGHRVE